MRGWKLRQPAGRAAARATAAAGTERAGGVLDQRQRRAARRAERPAEEMDGQDRLRPRADLELRGVDIHRLGIDVDEDGPQTRKRDDVRGRGEGVGGHEHLVAGRETECKHRQVQRRRSRRDGNRVLDLARSATSRSNSATRGPIVEHAAREDRLDCGELVVADARARLDGSV